MEKSELARQKKVIYDLLVAGNLEQAEEQRNGFHISAVEVRDIIEKAFHFMLREKKINFALKLCDQYNLPIEMRVEAVNANFRLFIKEKKYEEAIKWGFKYKLPLNEINTVAVKAFDQALVNGDVLKAIDLKNKYEIQDNSITKTGLHYFNMSFERKEYVKALYLGQEFEVSRKRSLTAAVRGFYQLLERGQINEFVEHELRYNILGDSDILTIDESDITRFLNIFVKNVVRKYFAEQNANKLADLIKRLDVFEKRAANPLIENMVKSVIKEVGVVHTELMVKGDYSSAFNLVDSFMVLKENLAPDVKASVIQDAETAHHKLIKEKNFPVAKAIKENYELFDRNIIADSFENMSKVVNAKLKEVLLEGDIDAGQMLIQEYRLPAVIAKASGGEAMLTHLQNRKLIEAIEIVNHLNVSVEAKEVKIEAATAFEESFKNGQMELASNIGYYFKIADPRVKEAAFYIWNKQMDAGSYSSALELKKRFRLSKKVYEPCVHELYDTLVGMGKSAEAAQLREHYNINVSVWAWILELFQGIMNKKAGQ